MKSYGDNVISCYENDSEYTVVFCWKWPQMSPQLYRTKWTWLINDPESFTFKKRLTKKNEIYCNNANIFIGLNINLIKCLSTTPESY